MDKLRLLEFGISGILHRQFLGKNRVEFYVLYRGILHRQFLGDDVSARKVENSGILHRQFLGI